MLYVKIPKDRVGALLGPKGTVKTQIEHSCGVTLKVDTKLGDVTIIPKTEAIEQGLVGLAARDIVKAIARSYAFVPSNVSCHLSGGSAITKLPSTLNSLDCSQIAFRTLLGGEYPFMR